jgi:hopene-associated glycosyltransferase HpnB
MMRAMLAVLAALAWLAWLALLLHPARPWDLLPVGELLPSPPTPETWPDVAVIVPARNEALTLPRTLPALLSQDYPGRIRVILVDERSTDDTAAVAERTTTSFGARAEIVRGTPLPQGWAGKPWGMQQGLLHSGLLDGRLPGFVLFTDADVLHARSSLRRLVAQSSYEALALNSRMAMLRCETWAERLLIPPFAFFFAVLYPMRRVNEPRGRAAAAAGGCMLVATPMLETMRGVEPIRDRVIDDVSLARAIRDRGGRLFLARSERDVASLRSYGFGDAWRMVRRTAFVQLRHSWALLLACLVALALVVVIPPVAFAGGLAGHGGWSRAALLLGGLAWTFEAKAFLPAVRAFGLPAWRAMTLPLAGLLYGAMTLDSALRHALHRPEPWREPTGDASPASNR